MVVAVGTRIARCTAGGYKHRLGQSFSFIEDCFQFNCDCYSNGSWECPSDDSRYICEFLPGLRNVKGISFLLYVKTEIFKKS